MKQNNDLIEKEDRIEKYYFTKYFIFWLIVIATLSVIVTGCEPIVMPEVEESEIIVDPITIFQNGHVSDDYDESDLNMPCSIISTNVGFVFETRLVEDKPEIMELRIRCANVDVFSRVLSSDYVIVYHDDTALELYESEEFEILDKLIIPSEDIGELTLFYELPQDADMNSLRMEFKPAYFENTLLINCREDGCFSDDDITTICENYGEILNRCISSEYEIQILEATSDSYYHSNKNGMDYTADLIIDNDYSTCWQDGSEGYGVGENLTFSFQQCNVGKISIVNGNRRNEDSYLKNGRLAQATLSFYLNDVLVDTCVIEIEDNPEKELETFLLETPVDCDTMILTIDSVFEGTNFSDTGISEVSICVTNYNPLMDVIYDEAYSHRSVRTTSAPTPTPTPNPNYIETGSMDNPTVIGFDEIPYLRDGIYVEVTGVAHFKNSDEGKIFFADRSVYFPDCGYGIELQVFSEDGKDSRTVDAICVSPGDFDEFLKGSHLSDIRGKKVTIVGRIVRCETESDGSPYYYYRFSGNSKIIAIE